MYSSPTGNDIRMQGRTVSISVTATLLILLLVAGCASTVRHGHGSMPDTHRQVDSLSAVASDTWPVETTPVLTLDALPDLQDVIPILAEKRVVFVGETHDRFDHHQVQLEIIRRLHALDPQLAIGVEFFQQPFQAVLDDYVAGKLSEQELLRDSEYFDRWGFDFRLYAPILRYAREHGLPLVALNLPAELTGKVGREGYANLTPVERALLPETIDRSDAGYTQRLRGVYDQHPVSGRSFDNFLEVQLLWDEGMAERAADYLANHPDYRMVVLAGSGHIARGSGIPRRLMRRLEGSCAIVLNGWEGELSPDLADFILLPEPRALPTAGQFGLLLETENPVPVVEACMPDSPCTVAGLKPGDRFLSINGEPIEDMNDLRLTMWDKQPGDTVKLRVSRKQWFAAPQVLSYSIELR